MKKEELIDEYVKQISEKINTMTNMFTKTTLSDRKHMENGFRYAVTSSIEVLKSLLPEENKFKNFIDKQLGWKAPTQEDIEQERAKIEMAKVKLDLAKVRAETNEYKKSGGDSPFAAFVKGGNEHNAMLMGKKKKNERDETL